MLCQIVTVYIAWYDVSAWICIKTTRRTVLIRRSLLRLILRFCGTEKLIETRRMYLAYLMLKFDINSSAFRTHANGGLRECRCYFAIRKD